MTLIANASARPPFSAPTSAVEADWANTMADLSGLLQTTATHPARAVVLLPYAQLMGQARLAWAAQCAGSPSFFIPRFETTQNWASALPGFAFAPEDIRLDAALDALTASGLLARAGLASRQSDLTAALVESAGSLARVAAAQHPHTRLAWGARLALEIGASMPGPALAFELAVARIALAWAAASNYPTDVLFSAQADLLVVIEGFQSDPLTQALKAHFGQRAASLLLTQTRAQGDLAFHAAADVEEEAHLAAACVLAHLAEGRSPVALVAQDRKLTRRVGAMLAEKGVALRDETGWKLSTTRAAATLMGLLRALPWMATTDAVLDWLKNAPAFDAQALTLAESALRKQGVRFWRDVPTDVALAAGAALNCPALATIAAQLQQQRSALQNPRPLTRWLQDVRSALQTAGQWAPLASDSAGMAVIAALHMDDDGLSDDFQSDDVLGDGVTGLSRWPLNPRMSLQDFTQWAHQALESASFTPPHPPEAQVVMLPLSQLLGRQLAAVVLPGCDEARLPVSSEPSGAWTPQQRALLGLPTREELDRAQRAAWHYALTAPHLDLLWRVSESGERLMPSGFVQELQLQQPFTLANEPRAQRPLTANPTPLPLPTGQLLPTAKLSASAYEDLRRCPYRFFALRLLKLQEADELESELGKRDFGNWLHLLLHTFQNALKNASNQGLAPDLIGQVAMLNIAADEATQALGLRAEEFLPFAAIWPRVRTGYLDWLATHEASGASYAEGEVWKTMPLGQFELVGKIDRIDQLPDGSRLVMDYKTEPSGTTRDRISDAGEDTQLAFYAALLEDDTLAAAYVNLGEKEPTKTYPQPDIVELRDDLIGGILSDLQRIGGGLPLPALGEGKACDYCAARGLCRKDFWT